jgi:hypothetical protein
MLGQALGIRYYFRDNYNKGNIIPQGTFHGKTPAQAAISLGTIHDGFGDTITSSEVDPDEVNGYILDNSDGSVEVLD